MQKRFNESVRSRDAAIATLGLQGFHGDNAKPIGRFHFTNHAVRPGFEQEYREIRSARDAAWAKKDFEQAHVFDQALIKLPKELVAKWSYLNLVVTGGRNDWLDKWLAGSAYTAAWYLGLISSVGWTNVVAGDTMASHAGWTEFVGYSNANRPTTAWSAASAGSKPLSAGLAFNINASGTVKGSFLTSNNTKSGTTGILATGGTFVGGDQPVVDTNTLTVTYSLSLT